MTDILYEWLKIQWKYNNHNKYQKYFKERIFNITANQIEHFKRMMTNKNIYENRIL